MPQLAVRLDRSALWRLAILLGLCNLLFISGMMTFLHYWDRREHFGPRGRAFIDYALVQFHLGAENVVAAWYSSMLLLLVAAACLTAFALDRRRMPASRGGSHLLDYGWIGLAVAFVVLSLDEIGSFHERIGMVRALNRASVMPHQMTAAGWVVILALPIAAVALFMLAFGWLRLRRERTALALLVVGVALYLCDPLLEMFEQAVKDRGGPLLLLERVLEEGVAELGGTCCILFGVLLYCRRIAGGRTLAFGLPPTRIVLTVTAVMTLLIPVAHGVVLRLPAADNGIPENWFPAAALFALGLFLMAAGGSATGAVALALSACFGAGLYGYVGLSDARLAVTMLGTVIAGVMAAALHQRAARRSPRSAQHSVQ